MGICERTGVIIGVCIGVVVLIIAILVIGCICYRRRYCAYYFCSKYSEIGDKLNLIDSGNMTIDQFTDYTEKIVQNLCISENQPILYQKVSSKNHRMKLRVKKLKAKPFLQQVSIVGVDNVGKFVGKGYILPKNGGEMYLWFGKIYKMKITQGHFQYY